MPHYKTGLEAKVTDVVIGTVYGDHQEIGVVLKLEPEGKTCNMTIARIADIWDGPAGRVIAPRAGDANVVNCDKFEKIA